MDSTKTVTLTASPSVREIHSRDGAALLDVNEGVCFTMNPVGAKIWNMLKANVAVDQIIAQLVSEFSLPELQVRQDVLEFVSSLHKQHLVVQREGSSTTAHGNRLFSILRRRAR
jgi:hypothetical protein